MRSPGRKVAKSIPTMFWSTPQFTVSQEKWRRQRDAEAAAAYEAALAPARRPSRDPARVPYPKAVLDALAAYDEIVHAYSSRIWPL